MIQQIPILLRIPRHRRGHAHRQGLVNRPAIRSMPCTCPRAPEEQGLEACCVLPASVCQTCGLEISIRACQRADTIQRWFHTTQQDLTPTARLFYVEPMKRSRTMSACRAPEPPPRQLVLMRGAATRDVTGHVKMACGLGTRPS